ncbi:hypothetical protein QUA04_06830 [Microcoleus sp. S13_C5]
MNRSINIKFTLKNLVKTQKLAKQLNFVCARIPSEFLYELKQKSAIFSLLLNQQQKQSVLAYLSLAIGLPNNTVAV